MHTTSLTPRSPYLCDVVDGVAAEGPQAIGCAPLHLDVDQALQGALVPASSE